ncbi:GntR family transcriptional regulator [Actinotalea sp. C106]|uniref:GntR family transcriptional regulator n=1 Tax=Actinotalea sp. C106 TaxID=2908644 RepID=UPI0020278CD9|nr:GntR family transcriptional regulator [Actinotalea sp. C106]
MKITVDIASSVPQYEQIRSQIAAHVTAGSLHQGDRLPTVRILASDLGIAPGTVARAYRELESAGQVVSRRRVGTVVSVPDRAPGRAQEIAKELVSTARSEGINDADVMDLVRSALLSSTAPLASH